MTKALILNDQKPGHLNQSIALVTLMCWEYDVMDIEFKNRSAKIISYLCDQLFIKAPTLYKSLPKNNSYDFIISAGSTTFYANKILSTEWIIPNIALLYPRGYRLHFNYIFCPHYDHPPRHSNIISLPVSLSCIEPSWYQKKAVEFKKTQYQTIRSSIGIVIGGSSTRSKINPAQLRKQLATILEKTPEHEHWVCTSRRTPPEVDTLLQEFSFDYQLIWSRNPYNPLPAFIELCDQLFITEDSASMISEAVSYGCSSVTVLETETPKKKHKLTEFIQNLIRDGYLKDMYTSFDIPTKKVNIKPLIEEALQDID